MREILKQIKQIKTNIEITTSDICKLIEGLEAEYPQFLNESIVNTRMQKITTEYLQVGTVINNYFKNDKCKSCESINSLHLRIKKLELEKKYNRIKQGKTIKHPTIIR